jgi:L-lactate dehydrogenase complex protein LldG
MSPREKILERVREGLQVAAPPPGHDLRPPGTSSNGAPPAANAREWLPLAGASFEERLALFSKNAAALKAEFHFVNGREEAEGVIYKLSQAEAWSKAATHRGELTDAVCPDLGIPLVHTDKGYDVRELEACSVGISECDALVAQTGSVLVTSRSAGGRALSVLPPHHLVLARREQLLADLPDAFALLKKQYAGNYPSFISLITGPSRTGDIERILVLGAHGPKKLTIVCW